jgi:hypothetical protein
MMPVVRILIAIESGKKSRIVGANTPLKAKTSQFQSAAGDWKALLELIVRLLRQVARELGRPIHEIKVISCYEAGYDGFWLHHELEAHGVRNHVVDPACLLVNRRAKPAKTDVERMHPKRRKRPSIQKIGHFWLFYRCYGGLLLLRRCCPAGVAAAFNCTRSRRLGGARALDHPRRAVNRIRCLERVHHHGGSQQRDPILLDRRGPTRDCERTCLGPKCYDATFQLSAASWAISTRFLLSASN